jgi:hypothetical protein
VCMKLMGCKSMRRRMKPAGMGIAGLWRRRRRRLLLGDRGGLLRRRGGVLWLWNLNDHRGARFFWRLLGLLCGFLSEEIFWADASDEIYIHTYAPLTKSLTFSPSFVHSSARATCQCDLN